MVSESSSPNRFQASQTRKNAIRCAVDCSSQAVSSLCCSGVHPSASLLANQAAAAASISVLLIVGPRGFISVFASIIRAKDRTSEQAHSARELALHCDLAQPQALRSLPL